MQRNERKIGKKFIDGFEPRSADCALSLSFGLWALAVIRIAGFSAAPFVSLGCRMTHFILEEIGARR
jgi:hypothetical protein